MWDAYYTRLNKFFTRLLFAVALFILTCALIARNYNPHTARDDHDAKYQCKAYCKTQMLYTDKLGYHVWNMADAGVQGPYTSPTGFVEVDRGRCDLLKQRLQYSDCYILREN